MAPKIDRWLEGYITAVFEEKYSYQQILKCCKILALYGKDIDKVELHMDKSSSHLCKLAATYLTNEESETGIKCILFDEIRIKSPYVSAIDFCAFGLLKRILGKRHQRTLNGLRKTFEEEGNKICMKLLLLQCWFTIQ
ncbi:UNVERIFIED_CONTAM: hypothetical protein NCL1_60596 [Trichonephila clavipes]